MSDILSEHEADKIVITNLLKELNERKSYKMIPEFIVSISGDVYNVRNDGVYRLNETEIIAAKERLQAQLDALKSLDTTVDAVAPEALTSEAVATLEVIAEPVVVAAPVELPPTPINDVTPAQAPITLQ